LIVGVAAGAFSIEAGVWFAQLHIVPAKTIIASEGFVALGSLYRYCGGLYFELAWY